jgi:amidase
MDAETLCYLSLHEVAEKLRNREISSQELTRSQLERIRKANPELRTYLTVLDDGALMAAALADAEISAGRYRGPLHGIPIAVKDLCQTKGILTTCASKVLRDWRPDFSATLVERLEAAGAVMLGKLNMTEFAVGWYHPEIPSPLNPWGPSLWPGASSSGSGAATAAGLCYGSIGSDTGGSIRLPSAANGIVGLKPTWGRVSRHGVFPLGESLDHLGPMTRSVADAAHMLSVIAGYDPADPTSLHAPVEDYAAACERGVKGLTIGLDEKYLSTASSEVGAAVIEAVQTLERRGAKVSKVTIPEIEAPMAGWIPICTAETAAAHEAYYPARAAAYGPGFRSFLEYGNRVQGKDYAKSYIVREGFATRFQTLFETIDVFACASMPESALPAGAIPDDVNALLGPNPLLNFTAPYNLSRNPTLSMPCGKAGIGAPPSLQLVGRLLGEATLIQAGAAFERATEWHEQRPPVHFV